MKDTINVYRNLESLISEDESVLVEIIKDFEIITRFYIPWKNRMTGLINHLSLNV